MAQITDQNQPVSRALSLTSRRASEQGHWAVAGKASRVKAELVTHRVFEPTSPRDPVGRARRSRHCSPARPELARRAPPGFPPPWRRRRVTVMWRPAGLGLNPESRRWTDGLKSPAAERDAVLARLHRLLRLVARHEAARRIGWLRLSGADLDDLAPGSGR